MRSVLKNAALTAGCILTGMLLLVYSGAAAAGAVKGIEACRTVLIPSLFPFLALSSLVGASSVSVLLTRILGPLISRLYGVSAQLAPAVLMSWIGGYPAGARVLTGMTATGRICARDAGLAMTFLVHSGPAFLTGIVGASLLGSARYGLFLYLGQIAAGILIGRLFNRGKTLRVVPYECSREEAPVAAAFVSAVTSAFGAMLNICAYVILFSALAGVLEACGLLDAAAVLLKSVGGGLLSQEGARLLVLSILEICSGCAAAAGVAPVQLAVVLPFALSFSSFSVIFQLASPLSEQKIPLGPMIASRFVHGLLTELLTAPLLLLWLRTTQTFASGTPVLQADERTVWMTGCLLLLAAFLFLKGEQLFALFTKKK